MNEKNKSDIDSLRLHNRRIRLKLTHINLLRRLRFQSQQLRRHRLQHLFTLAASTLIVMHAKIVICQLLFFSEERISASLGVYLVDRVKNDARVDGQRRVLLNSLLLVHSDWCFALSCKTVILRRFNSLIDVFCAYVESLARQLYMHIRMQSLPKDYCSCL